MRNKSTSLVSRAAARLDGLLTDLGHPLDPLGRANSLAGLCSVSVREATHLLSGIVPWTFADLGLVCEVFGKTPGFFLDPDSNQSIPADTSVVTSSDGGEATVWRAPNGFTSKRLFPKEPLRYLSISYPGYFQNNPVRSMLVYEDWTALSTQVPAHPDGCYIMEDCEGSLHPMICLDVNSSVAVFAKQGGNADKFIVPLHLNPDGNCSVRLAGQTIGAIQGW